MTGELVVYASPLPFSNQQTRFTAPAGTNLRQLVDRFRPESKCIGAIVLVHGERVPRSMWANVKPKVGTNVVIKLVPQGGGGKKNPLTTILTIAVLIAAPYAAAAMLGPTLAATSVLGGLTTYGGILSAGLGLVGRMAISALSPPPKQSNSGSGNVNNAAESPTQFIEGARNAIDPYGVVPINLGTNRMFPKQAARGFTETVGNDQYVRQLFCWGYGKVTLQDLKIGETDLTDFDEYTLEHKLQGDLSDGTALYANDVFQDDLNVLLQQVDGYTTRTTQDDADEAIVDVTFGTGLCAFDAQGSRGAKTVQLEVSYALNGVSPQVWSAGTASYKAISSASLTPAAAATNPNYTNGSNYESFRKDLVVVDKLSGIAQLIVGTGSYSSAGSCQVPAAPSWAWRLGTVTVKSTTPFATGVTATTLTIVDDRQAGLYGVEFENSSSFVPSISTSHVAVSSGGIKATTLNITGSQTEALRVSLPIRFPARDKYDIRIRRNTTDSSSDQVFDKATLSAIRSITHENPVNMGGLSGTAVRIKGTEQLNGALDEFNAVVTTIIPDYDPGTGTWIERASSNPASLVRFVWQNYGDGGANARPLPDSKISITDLEDWAQHCIDNGYTYNRVIDYETSLDEVIRDICSAGAASPDILDGKRTVAIDRVKSEISQVITPRNSWGYSGTMTYPDLPHAFRVTFRNSAKGYAQDERIVYDDGYSENGEVPDTLAATKFETLELLSCTSSDLAFKTGRRHIAAARLRPETHSFMLDVENLVAIRGNRILLAHDAPIVGVGDGRIKAVTAAGSSPDMVAGFTLDDTIAIPKIGTFYVRIRMLDGTTLYKELTTTIGEFKSFNFKVPFLMADAPEVGDLCYVVEAGGELDLIITKIEPAQDLSARITAINYNAAIFTAENTTIPAFDTHITTPLSLTRPLPPELVAEPQSDETVMLRNSDGSLTSRMIISLNNPNDKEVVASALVRVTGTTTFLKPNVLEISNERVVLTGLQDGLSYDVHIRYRRPGSNVYSLPLQINNYVYVGASTIPPDVENFTVAIVEGLASFKWDEADAVDISHYKLKFSKVFSGATWATSQTLEDHIVGNRISTTFQGGTYFIKAVDILGNESDNATEIITYEDDSLRNVVELVQEEPSFAGTKVNVEIDGSTIILTDVSIDGYYYFANTVDLGDVFTSFISANIHANGAFTAGSGGGFDLFTEPDIFALDDVFGVGAGLWSVQLEIRTTQGDTGVSPVTWTAWEEFKAGNLSFRGAQFRILMRSTSPSVTPQITVAQVTIDMPDRIVAENGISVGTGGLRINFDPYFLELQGYGIVDQNLQTGDYKTVTNVDETGFDIIYRNVAGTAVARTMSYIAKGYGRVVP